MIDLPDRADLEAEDLERQAHAAFRRDHPRHTEALDYLDQRPGLARQGIGAALYQRRSEYVRAWIEAEAEGVAICTPNRALLGVL